MEKRKHKVLLVQEIDNLTSVLLTKTKELSSLLTRNSQKEKLSSEIKDIENQLLQKLTISSNMRGY